MLQEKCDLEITGDLEYASKLINTKHEPFILRGFDIGSCKTKWTPEYLQSLNEDKLVKVHVCTTEKMDFLNKNFAYKTLKFNELIKRACATDKLTEYFIDENEKYYLRSLGEDERKDVSDIKIQFPELANDIQFPPLFDESKFFSSVFRISSPSLRLWTHYDIMDNFLIQVNGTKRVVLYSPSDVQYLYLKGDKSEILDIDNPDLNKYPLFEKAKRIEVQLLAGDVLFIPALWFHNVITQDFSIAVNVFWKHLDDQYYEKKDLYGNKDLVIANKAFASVDKCLKELNTLPDVYKKFYIRRLIDNLEQSLK